MLGLVQLKAYLYTEITANADLATIMDVVRFYDIVQESAVLPYISYDNISSKLLHVLDEEVTEHRVEFVIVAKADSSLTTHNIMATMERVFDGFAPEVNLSDGFALISSELIATQIEQVDFGHVKGRMEMKFLVEGGV